MFSTESAHATSLSLRNPRRRQRTNSDESVKPPKAKRQRSGLRHDTFDAPGAQVDDRANQAEEVLSSHGESAGVNGGTATKELALRVGRKEPSSDRADGTLILSSNDHFTVSNLPALPEQIRKDDTEPFRCVISAEYGYSLALTQYRGIIWRYTSSTSSPASNDVLTFPISTPSKGANDPLPLGAFVSQVGDPGLVVVIPSTGVITYWQTISSMAVVGLVRQKQNGIQGSVPGMLSGEVVTDIINAEPSGLIISFSTGRVAHVAIRDAQGKPAVSCEFLRGSMRGGGGGLFGGIKSVLGGGSWRKEVAAVRTGASAQRGQRDVVIATGSGVFELWDTHWNNGNVIKTQIDLKNQLLDALRDFDRSISNENERDFKILDFGIDHENSHMSRDEDDSGRLVSLFALAAVSEEENQASKLFVIQLTISGGGANVGFVRTVGSYHLPHDAESSPKPRLYLPKPGNSAFIILDKAIVLLSLAQIAESPTSQLLTDTDTTPAYVRDFIHFRTDGDFAIQGSGVEDCDNHLRKHPSCLLMVRNVGMIRVSSLLPQADFTSPEPELTIKSRIEEAVFFGSIRNTPLDFTHNKDFVSQVDQVEQAALNIGEEILRSSSRFIPSTATSLEQHLQLRARALENLAKYLSSHCHPISRHAKWTLLWGAERLAAQRAIWRVEEEIRRKAGSTQTHLDQVLGQMGNKYRTKIDSDKGENDRVRHWLVHDTWRMEYVIPWLLNGIRELRANIPKHGRLFAEQLAQSSTLSLATLETAFNFREDNAPLYGLSDENLDNGVLVSGYKGLPEFWTSQELVYVEADNLLDLELKSCLGWAQKQLPKSDTPDPQTVEKIKQSIPRQFQVFSRMHTERCRWGAEQEDEKVRNDIQQIDEKHVEGRRFQLFRLAATGQLEVAITLAEGFRDMPALVELMLEIHDGLKEKEGTEPETYDREITKYDERIDGYFERFGESWADAYFSRQVSSGVAGQLLTMSQYQTHLTKFLRKKAPYRKVSWMNDIIGERDYSMAAKTLANLAIDQESDLWGKRVQLSIGKLTKLAAVERNAGAEQEDAAAMIKRFDDQAELSTIQETLYEHILPCLHGAIDERAELQLAMEQFGIMAVKGKPALHEVLGGGLRKLVAHEAMQADEVIHVLTLMDPVQFLEGEDDGILGHEFYLALRVLHLSGYSHSDAPYHEALEKMIWWRSMIRDNWEMINKTEKKGDQQVESEVHATALFTALTECSIEELSGSGKALSHRRFSPTDILESENLAEVLVSHSRPEERARIAHDLETELGTLRLYSKKGRLDDWFPTLVNSAKETAKTQSQPDVQDAPGGGVVAEMSGALTVDHEGEAPPRMALRWV
ncbi:hypothetical protein FQN54_007311 [Arachnomyces sp. PD_36]|nr:hypothetical protein FQN54_007311 [Arachnomyces sp. PD_36]